MSEFLSSKFKSAARWWCTFPLIAIIFFLGGSSSYAQPITGIVPVQTPLGGSGVDGDAMAHTPAGYENVGDLFDGVHLTGTHGVLDLTTGTLLYPGYTFFLQDPYLDDKTIFTSTNKINDDPNTYTWGAGSSPNKNEIQNAGAHFSYGSPALGGSASDLWVLFAGDRQVTNGSSYIDFEFLQKSLTMNGAFSTPINPQTGTATITGGSGNFTSEGTDGGRTVGDVLLTIEFQQGGGDAVVSIRKWEAVGDGFEYVIHPNSEFVGDIFITQNTVETSVPFDVYGTNPGTYAVNQWAEGAANLTALFAEDPCFSISTLFIRTRSSGNSNQSELKDFPGAPIQLTVNNIPEVAVNSPSRCADGPAATITATPTPAGSYTYDWDVPVGAIDPGNVPSFDATVAGTYSVTVTNAATCSASGSGVLTVDPPAEVDAGDDQTVCSSAPEVTLDGSVDGGATSGTWSGGNGTFDPDENTLNAVYTPSADEIAAGTVTLTLTTNEPDGPCEAVSDTMTITINEQPDAGDDGDTTVCDSSTDAIILANLITGEDAGGVWARTSGTGGSFDAATGTFTPALGATTSTFSYTLEGDAPCIDDSSIATVNINAQPDAGDDGSTLVCDASTDEIDLYDLIDGEDAGGTWARTSGTGGSFDAAAGTFTPSAGATTSTFTYTVDGEAPCEDDSSIATVNINGQVDAGDDGQTTVCDSSTDAIILADLITGEDLGGTWSRTSGTGGSFDAAAGTFTPAPSATTSTFTYLLDATDPCLDDESVATVNINEQPDAGDDGDTTVCDSSTDAIILADLITGEDLGGTWARTSGTGGSFDAAAGTFTPSAGATTSTFTYTVDGEAPCEDDSSIATVNINGQVDAGDDGQTTVCDSSTDAIILADLITGEDPGGTWSRTSGTGGSFDAAAGTFTPAPGATTSTFTYLLDAPDPCLDDESVAAVNINEQPDAGDDGDTTVCDSSTDAIILADLITGEDAGGTWARTSGTGGTFDAAAGTFTPASGATTSTFTYTVDGEAPCEDDSSIATVNINALPTAQISYDGPYCTDVVGTVPVTLNGTGDYTGGTFSAGAGLTIDPVTGAITPSTSLPGTYDVSYTIAASGECPEVIATVSVTIEECNNFEGCTLGYWKNHIDRWCSAYTPTMTFGSIFTSAPSSLASKTLLQILNLQGGGANNLARQAVAALLNACSDEVDYATPYGSNPQAVIDAVNAAFEAGGSAPGMLGTELDLLNNAYCPLGGTSATKQVAMSDVTLYPTPFKESIGVHYNFDYESDVQIEILDITGKVLMVFKDHHVPGGKDVVLTPEFIVGENQLYFVRVTTDRGVTVSKALSGK